MENQHSTFPSRIDTWQVLLLAVGLGAAGVPLVRRILSGQSLDTLAAILLALASGFVIWVFTTTSYEVTPDQMIVRSGPFRTTVPLGSVQRLRATHNPLSAPALSLDRIEVTYGSKRILISPRDKRGFVNAVIKRAPGVELEGLWAI